MMTMKIDDYISATDTDQDAYTFQHNPTVVDISTQKFVDQKDISYAFTYFGMTRPLKSKLSWVLDGHFDKATKSTEYASLAKHINDNNLKKLFFSDDRFAIVVPISIKRSHQGGRTNFIDYNAAVTSPFGIQFGTPLKSGDDSSTETNDGDVFSPFEKITGSVTSGDTVVIEDKDGNGFEFVASATGTFNFYLIYLEDLGNDNYFTEYLYGEISGIKQTLKIRNSAKSMILGLDADEDINTRFTGGTIENITPTFDVTNITPTFYVRDAYMSD